MKDELSYLWEEYQYRHDLVWRVTLRLTFVVAFLSIIPYVNDSLSTKMGKWMLVPPILSVLLAIFGSAVIANEYQLLVMIKDAYRCLQSEFFCQTFREVPQYPAHGLFGPFLVFYLLSLAGLALANFIIVAAK